MFKNGDEINISNYRHISHLTSFSAVLERATYIQLCEHINKNNIFTEVHFCFRTKSTKNNAIYKLTNEILKALNNKIMVGGIFYDLEKSCELTIKSYYLNWSHTV